MKTEAGWTKLHADFAAVPVFAFPLAGPTALSTHQNCFSGFCKCEVTGLLYAYLARGAQNYMQSISDRRLVSEIQRLQWTCGHTSAASENSASMRGPCCPIPLLKQAVAALRRLFQHGAIGVAHRLLARHRLSVKEPSNGNLNNEPIIAPLQFLYMETEVFCFLCLPGSSQSTVHDITHACLRHGWPDPRT